MMKAALTNGSPADHDAMSSSTVDVIKYHGLELDRDVFEHFQRQDPVVARQPVLRQRQVQELHLHSAICITLLYVYIRTRKRVGIWYAAMLVAAQFLLY